MRSGALPFRFDISGLLATVAQNPNARATAVPITLPFVSVMSDPTDRERRLAGELVVQLRDRRVLQSRECCDGCIDDALRSLQEIRSELVRAQLQLVGDEGVILGQLVELMLIGIR